MVKHKPAGKLPDAGRHLHPFRNAILGEQQVVCGYDGRLRELCPHIIGTNRSGEEVVLVKFRVPSDRPRGRFLRKPDMRPDPQVSEVPIADIGQRRRISFPTIDKPQLG